MATASAWTLEDAGQVEAVLAWGECQVMADGCWRSPWPAPGGG